VSLLPHGGLDLLAGGRRMKPALPLAIDGRGGSVGCLFLPAIETHRLVPELGLLLSLLQASAEAGRCSKSLTACPASLRS